MTDVGLVELLGMLFADLGVRAPFGVTWMASGRDLPVAVEVTPADSPTRSFTIAGGAVTHVVADFAADVQKWLIPQLRVPVPPCPHDGAALRPQVVESTPHWLCPNGDFDCEFGGYLPSLWPPALDDSEAAPMLARRLHDAGIQYRSAGFGRRGDRPIAQVELYFAADEPVARAVAAPFDLEIRFAEPAWTERFTESTSEGRFEGLRLRGGGPHWLAILSGVLGRPRDDEDADVLVGDVEVRLGPKHRIGGPGEALLLDADGRAFADAGDHVTCGGGFPPPTGVRGERRRFYAWEIRLQVSGS